MDSEIRRIMRSVKGTKRKRIVVSIAHIVCWPIFFIPRLFWPVRRREPSLDKGRILLVRIDGIGDLAMSTAAISSLRRKFPNARIDLLTSDVATPVAELLKESGWINMIWTMPLLGRRIPDYMAMLTRLHAERYDAALDLRGDARTNLLTWFAGIPMRIGLRGSGFTYLLTDAIGLPENEHQATECFELIKRLGIHEVDQWPRLPLRAQDIDEANRWLTAHGVKEDRPICAMHLGAFTPTKLWPLDRFLDVARRLEQSCQAQILLVGGKADARISRRFEEQFNRNVMIAAGETTLKLSASLLSRCAVMIGNDSGPAHVAAYVGCPVVVLFGPGSPKVYAPLSPQVMVMKSARECDSGCERACVRATGHCMLDHTVEAVAAAAEQFVRAPRIPLRELNLPLRGEPQR